MGCGASVANIAEAQVIVSPGQNTLENTHHACFMLCLQMDVYHEKYANAPIAWTVTPCPTGLYDKYGAGTQFTGFNHMGQQEQAVITEVKYLESVTIAVGGITIKYITTRVENGCSLSCIMEGARMGSLNIMKAIAMTVNTMKAFIELNVPAICAKSPLLGPGGEAVPAVDVSNEPSSADAEAQVDSPPQKHSFCSGCGQASNGGKFCSGCGMAAAGSASPAAAPAAPEFVDAPQHALAQKAVDNMAKQAQQEQMLAAVKRAGRN